MHPRRLQLTATIAPTADVQKYKHLGALQPMHMPDASQLIISEILSTEFNSRLIFPGEYTLTMPAGISYQFFTQYILGIQASKYGDLYCYLIDPYQEPLAKTKRTTVANILGKIVYRFDKHPGYRYEPDANKTVAVLNETPLDPAQPNVQLTTLSATYHNRFFKVHHIKHLRTRAATIGVNNHSLVACSTMRKFQECDLESYLKRHRAELSELDCIEICLSAAKALKSQVSPYGIIHRDIKDQNMILQKIKNKWAVKIIDYEFSIDATTTDNATKGTLLFLAPEATRFNYSTATDIYSLFVTFCLILNHQQFVELDREINNANSGIELENLLKKKWNTIPDFQKNPLISASIRARLTALIQRGLHMQPVNRPDIDSVIAELEEIKIDLQLSLHLIPNDNKDAAYNILQKARTIKKEIEQLLQTSPQPNFLSLQEHANFPIADPVFLKLFIDYLDLPCMDNIAHPLLLISELDKIIHEHQQAQNLMQSCLRDLKKIYHDGTLVLEKSKTETDEENDNDTIDGDLQAVILLNLKNETCKFEMFVNEMQSRPTTLEGIIKAMHDMQKKHGKIRETLEFFTEKMATLTTHKRLRK